MEGTLSPADVAVLSGNNRNSGMFGDGNGAWWIVLFLIFGWGRNGFGGYGNGGGAMDNYVLNSDFATLSRQISDGFNSTERRTDQIINGLCDGFYTNAQLINGVNTNILTSTNGIQSQLASCCCDIREGIQGVNYNLSQNGNLITNAINNGIRDVMQNCNNNYRQLHEELVNARIEDKNAQIAMLQTKLNNAELRASQEAQSNYLYTAITDKLSPCPRPAYLTCNPNAPINYSISYASGCNGGCGY